MKLEIYYPVKPFIKYQSFGANLACVENTTLPIAKRKVVSKVDGLCPVGYVELYPILGMKGHTGTDMFGGSGYPCYYAGPEGIVEEVQTEIERGLGVGVVTKEKYSFENGEYYAKTRYWHLKGIEVSLGQIVKTGDLIGYCDNTGVSAGDHLHFELKAVFKNQEGVYYNVFQDNGYYGGCDPEKYFNRKYAQDFSKFNIDLEFGVKNKEVGRLQTKLKEMGFFTYPEVTEYYGVETRKAVYEFQKKYVVLSPYEYLILRGKKFGPKTRDALNKL